MVGIRSENVSRWKDGQRSYHIDGESRLVLERVESSLEVVETLLEVAVPPHVLGGEEMHNELEILHELHQKTRETYHVITNAPALMARAEAKQTILDIPEIEQLHVQK
jgi:hypothetical protein